MIIWEEDSPFPDALIAKLLGYVRIVLSAYHCPCDSDSRSVQILRLVPPVFGVVQYIAGFDRELQTRRLLKQGKSLVVRSERVNIPSPVHVWLFRRAAQVPSLLPRELSLPR